MINIIKILLSFSLLLSLLLLLKFIIIIIIEHDASMKTSLWHFPRWLYTNDNAGASFILQL